MEDGDFLEEVNFTLILLVSTVYGHGLVKMPIEFIAFWFFYICPSPSSSFNQRVSLLSSCHAHLRGD